MLAEQRSAPPEVDQSGGIWLDDEPEAASPDPARDRYAVIDELIDDVAILVVAPWPTYDEFGRLDFGPETKRGEVRVDVDLLHARVAQFRSLDRYTAPTRPLRIGDTFRLTTRDAEARLTAPAVTTEDLLGMVDRIEDVTHWARDAAKMAFFAAVSPRLDPRLAASLEMFTSEGDDDRGTGAPGPGPDDLGPGPTATPAV